MKNIIIRLMTGWDQRWCCRVIRTIGNLGTFERDCLLEESKFVFKLILV